MEYLTLFRNVADFPENCINMPGPKMGPRPVDFDEELVRKSPTFNKWQKMENGQRLRYACRDFVKGHGDDEERLMRRIMIARRNNLRDHETLKKARSTRDEKQAKKRRTNGGGMSDAQVEKEMDVPAVVGTRSYRQWASLPDGTEFSYNQKYVKGRDGHDWLLRKNIWRRMRYRRENKKMVERLKGVEPKEDEESTANQDSSNISAAAATHIVDQALLASAAAAATTSADNTLGDEPKKEDQNASDASGPAHDFVPPAVVEAAVAAAQSYVKVVDTSLDSIAAMTVPQVDNPLEAAASTEALDAAARLAAATAPMKTEEGNDDPKICIV